VFALFGGRFLRRVLCQLEKLKEVISTGLKVKYTLLKSKQIGRVELYKLAKLEGERDNANPTE